MSKTLKDSKEKKLEIATKRLTEGRKLKMTPYNRKKL